MELKKINESTAVDNKGAGWFRMKTGDRHEFWIKCDKCQQLVQFYWTDWPDKTNKLCDNCIDWS
jgi:acetyl-CoA carboxylase beta subunit